MLVVTQSNTVLSIYTLTQRGAVLCSQVLLLELDLSVEHCTSPATRLHVVAGVFGVPPLLLPHSAETYEHSVSTDCAVQLSCSRASELDDARRRTLAAMVEGAAGTVGGRSGPTAGKGPNLPLILWVSRKPTDLTDSVGQNSHPQILTDRSVTFTKSHSS
jgi:hypothetical protein